MAVHGVEVGEGRSVRAEAWWASKIVISTDASSGAPSWKVTPARRVTVHCHVVGVGVNDSAR